MDVKHFTLPSLKEKQIAYFWSKAKFNPATGCLEWTGSKHGCKYARVKFNQIRILVHRLAYFLYHGTNPKEFFVLHSCDNPICVAKDHLFLGDHKDNMKDMALKNRAATGTKHGSKTRPEAVLRGEKIGLSKLQATDISAIRQLAAAGNSLRTLARKYGVTTRAIVCVIRRITWKHIP